MKSHKCVAMTIVFLVTACFALPAGSFACWFTGTYQVECCFVCCDTYNDCDALMSDQPGVDPKCVFNWYCMFNPGYCTRGCDEGPCAVSFALHNDEIKIDTLRKFRDEILSKTPVGREYIRLYYEWSPVIVQAMEEDDEFKAWVKETIENLMPMIERAMK